MPSGRPKENPAASFGDRRATVARVSIHEAAVLEQQQRDQVEDDSGGDPRPGPAGGAGVLDLQPEHVVRGDRRKEQHDEDRLAPGIENDAERRQSPFAAARRVEDQEEQRQEVEQESDAAEHHAWSAPWPGAGTPVSPPKTAPAPLGRTARLYHRTALADNRSLAAPQRSAASVHRREEGGELDEARLR